ncbi:MAG TPA: hypothetical protein VGI66_10710 [Streptosporangiaceae bacterium]|jgi:hypothetical protein
MFVIRMANGNLLVPEYALDEDARVIGDAYVEIGPEHVDFARLGTGAITWQEDQERRQHWRDSDESLRREFLDYLARHGSAGGWGTDHGEPD